MNLSVVIITLNEERAIGRCLDSVQTVADEIVVIDAGSTDGTAGVCGRYPVRFLSHPFEGYVQQKNRAVAQASNDIVLSLDADEALSEELRESVLKVKNDWKCDGYLVNRLTNYCGTWIRHTDWYPDRKIRLWDRRRGGWGGMLLHEDVVMRSGSSIGRLRGDLLHYSYDSVKSHLERMRRYTDLMAQEAFTHGKKAGIVQLTVNPLWKFVKSYVVRAGFLDGYHGLVIGALSAYATYLKYSKTRDLYRKNRGC